MNKKELDDLIKKYLDIQLEHFKLDLSMILPEVKRKVDYAMEKIRLDAPKASVRFSKKYRKKLENRAEEYLKDIKSNYYTSKKLTEEMKSLIQTANASIYTLQHLIKKLHCERFDYMNFLFEIKDFCEGEND